VTSVDVEREVLAEAWDHLRHFPDRRVQLQQADGRQGFPGGAPYDRIMATAATPRIERAWLEQLAAAGLVSAPLVVGPGLAFVVCGTVRDGIFTGRLMRAAYFMPLRGEGEPGPADEEAPQTEDRFESATAPWADWLQRRRLRGSWLRLGQSLAFYALLRGLDVYHRSQEDGQPIFGIGDGTNRCWFGPAQWLFLGPQARDLARNLWRAFLDAGGPWPTEFELRLGVSHDVVPSGGHEEYIRNVEGERQVWQLIEPRERGNWI
jgi:hypothetical protein